MPEFAHELILPVAGQANATQGWPALSSAFEKGPRVFERASEEVVTVMHLSESAKRANFLSHQVAVRIGGKMWQLTDTDMSFSMKAAGAREKVQMRNEMRSEARASDEIASFRRGPKELLRIAHACHEAMVLRGWGG